MLASVTFNSGTGALVVLGNAIADTISLTESADYQSFTVDINNNASLQQTFNYSDVTSVKVLAGDGDDFVYNTLRIDTEIHGQGGDDRLEGGWANDLVTGGTGIDILVGRHGDDALNGQGGNDWLYGGPGVDALIGLAGNDKLYGGTGDDTLNGSGGDDSLWGEAGDDSLLGGAGDDLLRGEDGNDTLRGEGGDDWLVGGDGDDVLRGDEGADELLGQAGNDILIGGTKTDILYGGTGDDTLRGDAGNDELYGGADDDLLLGNDGNDLIRGDGGDDTLRGGDGNDSLFGLGGADFLYGDAGDDSLDAGGDQAADVLTGGIGLDQFVVVGGSADEVVDRAGFETYDGYNGPLTALADIDGSVLTVRGLPGDDHIYIDNKYGQDAFELKSEGVVLGIYSTLRFTELVINSGGGDDLIFNNNRSIIPMRVDGGDGDDIIHGGLGNDILNGGNGADHIWGHNGEDQIFGNAGDDDLRGGQDDDELIGGTGEDELHGDGDDDTLRGGDGNDILHGGTSNDLLFGDAGADDLWGGSGADQFFVDDQDDVKDQHDSSGDTVGPAGPVGTASIGDLVFSDADGDGVFDAGEIGISDVAVTLFSGTTVVATQTTDSAGHYLFEDLPEGDYRVELVTDLTGNYVLTTATSIDVELTDGEVLDTVDFGASLLPEEVIVQRSIQLITEGLDSTVTRDVFDEFTSSLISASTEEVGNSIVVTAGVRKYVFQEISGDVFQFAGSFPSSLPSVAATELTANKTAGVFLHIIEKDRVGGTQGEFAVFSASEAGELRNVGDYLPGGNSINFAQPALDIDTTQDALQVVNEIYVGDYYTNPLAMYKTVAVGGSTEQVGPIDVARGVIDLAMTPSAGPPITAAVLDGFSALLDIDKTTFLGTANSTIEKAFVKISPNWYKHDLYPRNWEYNTHSLLVELPSEAERDSVLDALYLSIQDFEHLNVDGNNNSTIQTFLRMPAVAATDFTSEVPRTRFGRFNLKIDFGVPNLLDRLNIDVIIEDHDTVLDQNGQATGAKELQVVTINQHPLVGSRKFRVEPVGDNQIKIITEAWEHSANGLAQWGKELGPPLVNQLWTTYIENLADYAEELGAERAFQTGPGGVQTDQVFRFETSRLGGVVVDGILQRNDNPFRNDLRIPYLKVSDFAPASTGELRNAFRFRTLYEADPLYLKNFNP